MRALSSASPLQARLLWGFSFLFLVGYHWLAYAGHFGYDDMLYAKLSHGILQGKWDASDHFSFRWAVLLPTALSYGLFGVSDFSSALPAWVSSWVALGVVIESLKRYGFSAMLLGVGLVLLHYYTLYYSDKLMADIPLAMATTLAVWLVARARYVDRVDKHPWLALGWAAALLYGFLAKGTILLTLPLWLWLAGQDLWLRRHLRFWGWALFWGGLLLGGYLAIIYAWTGDPLARFGAIAANAYQNVCSYELQPSWVLWRRISSGWALNLLKQGSWPACMILLGMLGQARLFGHPERRYWVQSLLVLIGAANFMTISLGHYQPMCVGVRHYLYVIPVAAIAVSPALWQMLQERRSARWATLWMLAATALAWYQGFGTAWWLYAPLTGVLLLRMLLPPRRVFSHLLLGLWLMALALYPLKMSLWAYGVDYASRRDAVVPALEQLDPSLPVLTDDVWSNMGPYYEGFGPDQQVYYPFKALDTLSVDPPFYLLLDGHTQYLSGLTWESLPYYAQHLPPQAERLVADHERGIQLVRVDSLPQVRRLGEYVLRAGAEDSLRRWVAVRGEIREPTDPRGPLPGLRLSLDSLGLLSQQKLIVRSRFQAWKSAEVPLHWAVGIENDAGLLGRREIRFDPFLWALTTWWTVRLETVYTPEQWRGATRLQVFPMKPPKGTLRVDSAWVEVLGW